jgi:hypothetical protein
MLSIAPLHVNMPKIVYAMPLYAITIRYDISVGQMTDFPLHPKCVFHPIEITFAILQRFALFVTQGV